MDGAPRLPAHLEAAGLIRAVAAAGGFATILARGERDAGTLLLVLCENGRDYRLFERMPDAAGGRAWLCVKRQDIENPAEFHAYCERRRNQDRDLWLVELDIAGAERFIG